MNIYIYICNIDNIARMKETINLTYIENSTHTITNSKSLLYINLINKQKQVSNT